MSVAEQTSFLNGRVILHRGDCLDVLDAMAENSVDSIVCDPPYHLTSIVRRFGADDAAPCKFGSDGAFARASRGFMGKQWDGGDIAFRVETWRKVLRVLKPGGHVVAFSGTRTYHRMAVAIEDAGFEIRDMLQWLYGSGFPKSHDVSKAIDKAHGAAREVIAAGEPVKRMIPGADQHRSGWEKIDGCMFTPVVTAPATDAARAWEGWGTALKPACEPVCFGRKPLSEPSVATNVLRWSVGAINVDACRVAFAGAGDEFESKIKNQHGAFATGPMTNQVYGKFDKDRENWNLPGRWPANVLHDGSVEVVAAFPLTSNVGHAPKRDGGKGALFKSVAHTGGLGIRENMPERHFDAGSAARFFYSAKADADDRLGSKHPTVKPVDLMRWLVRLVTPPGGLVLDPFAGTGTTGAAAALENMRAVLIEREPEYAADIARRMSLLMAGPTTKAATLAPIERRTPAPIPLFPVGEP